jgi:hypothetical protein
MGRHLTPPRAASQALDAAVEIVDGPTTLEGRMGRWLPAALLLAACSSGELNHPRSLDGFLAPYDMGSQGTTGSTTGSTTGGGTTGASTTGSTTGSTTSGSTTGSTTSGGTTGSTTPGGGGLDPSLAPAGGGGQSCMTPGGYNECPNQGACRFYTSTEARCEDPQQEEPLLSPCTTSAECSTLFVCYQNRCESFCHLGTSECGAISDCVDVGWINHDIGVCQS